MRLFKYWKLILGLLVIFTAGAVTGSLLTLQAVKQAVAERSTFHWWVQSRLREMDRRLKLTHEQRQKISPIIEKAGGEFQTIAGDTMGQVMALLEKTHHEISAELTPEQKLELHKIELEAMQRWHEFTSADSKKKTKNLK